MTSLKNKNRLWPLAEIALLFVMAFVFISLFSPLAGESLVYKQLVVWFANILMLFYVWGSLKLRGRRLSELGITFNKISFKAGLKTFSISLGVFIAAMAAFVLASVLMANISGIPESSDLSGYEYMQDNPGMFFLTLFGTYIVASFGEEVIYRGYLINRLIDSGLGSAKGKVLAVAISALIFGLVHYQWGAMGIVQTTFMGAVLGYFYLKLHRRIWVLVLAHGYMDTILMVQMYLSSN